VTCLTLLASTGKEPEWNSRKTSANHRAIPLVSEQMVASFPMVSHLIRRLGLNVTSLVDNLRGPTLEVRSTTYNVFYVPTAEGSVDIPAQNLVRRFGIQSVIGFGGLVPDGEMFAVVLFCKTYISRENAIVFGNPTLNTQLALLRPLYHGRLFTDSTGLAVVRQESEEAVLRAEIDMLRLLLESQEHNVLEQSAHMGQPHRELEQLAREDSRRRWPTGATLKNDCRMNGHRLAEIRVPLL